MRRAAPNARRIRIFCRKLDTGDGNCCVGQDFDTLHEAAVYTRRQPQGTRTRGGSGMRGLALPGAHKNGRPGATRRAGMAPKK